MEYTVDEMLNLITPELISNARDAGIVYVRQDGEEVHACFGNDNDPGCQMSYVIVSNDSDEWGELDIDQQNEEIADTLCALIEDDPDSYELEVSFYTALMLGD